MSFVSTKRPSQRAKKDISETEDEDEEAFKKVSKKPASSKGKVSAIGKDVVAYQN